MPTLRIPTPLRPYTDGQSDIPVQGETVAEILESLTANHPAIRGHIFNEGGELRAFVNLFVNDEDVRFLRGADTPVSDDDRLMILPSIAGGGRT